MALQSTNSISTITPLKVQTCTIFCSMNLFSQNVTLRNRRMQTLKWHTTYHSHLITPMTVCSAVDMEPPYWMCKGAFSFHSATILEREGRLHFTLSHHIGQVRTLSFHTQPPYWIGKEAITSHSASILHIGKEAFTSHSASTLDR